MVWSLSCSFSFLKTLFRNGLSLRNIFHFSPIATSYVRYVCISQYIINNMVIFSFSLCRTLSGLKLEQTVGLGTANWTDQLRFS